MGFDPLDDLEDFVEDLFEAFFDPPPRRRERTRKRPRTGPRLLTTARLARALKLRETGGWVATGEVAGRRIEVRAGSGKDDRSELWVVVEVPLEIELPKGMALVEAWRTTADGGWIWDPDKRVRVKGPAPEELAPLVESGAIGTILEELFSPKQWHFRLEVRDRRLRAAFPRSSSPREAVRRVEAIVGLARAVEHAWLGSWRAVGARRGWRLDSEKMRLEGTEQGVAIGVRLWRDAPVRTTVVARVTPALPEGSLAGHPELHEDEVDIGDPILDPLLALMSSDAEALGRRLSRDAVRGPLLELVHEFPGSMLRADQVVLVVAGMLADPTPAIQLVGELARALGPAGSSEAGGSS